MPVSPIHSAADLTPDRLKQFQDDGIKKGTLSRNAETGTISGTFILSTADGRDYEVYQYLDKVTSVEREANQRGCFSAIAAWFARVLPGSTYFGGKEFLATLQSLTDPSHQAQQRNSFTTTGSDRHSDHNDPEVDSAEVDSDTIDLSQKLVVDEVPNPAIERLEKRIASLEKLAEFTAADMPKNASNKKFDPVKKEYDAAMAQLITETKHKAAPLLTELAQIKSSISLNPDQFDCKECEGQLTAIKQTLKTLRREFHNTNKLFTDITEKYADTVAIFTNTAIQNSLIERISVLINQLCPIQDLAKNLKPDHALYAEAIKLTGDTLLLKRISDQFKFVSLEKHGADELSEDGNRSVVDLTSSLAEWERICEEFELVIVDHDPSAEVNEPGEDDNPSNNTLLTLLADCASTIKDINEELNRIEATKKTQAQQLYVMKEEAASVAEAKVVQNLKEEGEKLAATVSQFIEKHINEFSSDNEPPGFTLLRTFQQQLLSEGLDNAALNLLTLLANENMRAIGVGLKISVFLDHKVIGDRGINSTYMSKGTHHYPVELQARIHSLIHLESLCYNNIAPVDLNSSLPKGFLPDWNRNDLDTIDRIAQIHCNEITRWNATHFGFTNLLVSKKNYPIQDNVIYEMLPDVISGREAQTKQENQLDVKIKELKKKAGGIDTNFKPLFVGFAYFDNNTESTHNHKKDMQQAHTPDQVRNVLACGIKPVLEAAMQDVLSAVSDNHKKTFTAIQQPIHQKLKDKEQELRLIKIANADTGELSGQKIQEIERSIGILERQLQNIININNENKKNISELVMAISLANNHDLIPHLLSRLTSYAGKLNEIASYIQSINTTQNQARLRLAQEQAGLIRKIVLIEFNDILTPPVDSNPANAKAQGQREVLYKTHTETLLGLVGNVNAQADQFEQAVKDLHSIKTGMQKEIDMGAKISAFLAKPHHDNAIERIKKLGKLESIFIQPTIELKARELFAKANIHMNAIAMSEKVAKFLEDNSFGDNVPVRIALLRQLQNQFDTPAIRGDRLKTLIAEAENHMNAFNEGIAISSYLDGLKENMKYDEESQARINSLLGLKNLCYDPDFAPGTKTFKIMGMLRDRKTGMYDPDVIQRIATNHIKHVSEWITTNTSTDTRKKTENCTYTYEALGQLNFQKKVDEIKQLLRETLQIAHQHILKMEQRGEMLTRLVGKTEKLRQDAEEFKRKCIELHHSFLLPHERIYRNMLEAYESLKKSLPATAPIPIGIQEPGFMGQLKG